MRAHAWSHRGLLLALTLLLSCSQERVDLEKYGTAGSFSRAATPAVARPAASAGNKGLPVTPPPMPTTVLKTIPKAAPAPPFGGLRSRDSRTPPIAGGTLAVAADGSVAVAADADRDLVFVVDPNSMLTYSMQLPQASEPGRVLLDDIGQAHIVLRSGERLARIDLQSKTLTLSESLCQQPRGLAYVASNNILHVACADGQLLQLSAADYSELARERYEPDLRDIVVLKDGTRVVSRFRSAQLLWLDPSGARTLSPPVLPWPKLALDGASDAAVGSVDTSATFAFRTVYDANTGVWMLHERAQLDALDADARYHGQDTGCGPVVQPALSLFGSATDEPSTRTDLQLQGIAAPAIDLALSAGWLAVVTPSAYASQRATLLVQQRSFLDQNALIRSRDQDDAEFSTSTVGVCPTPAFYSLEIGAQAVAVAFDQNNRLYVQTRYPSQLSLYSVMPSDASVRWIEAIKLASGDVRDLGNEWFHAELGESRLSCAACHAEGLDDGHTWISGDKARRTPSLRGGIKQTAPYFWGGESGSFDALVNDVVTGRVAAPSISAEATNALLTWLDSLPAIALHSDAPAAVRGKALFESSELACASCHSGPQLTNNLTVSALLTANGEDAGTLAEPMQVPSLLGLSMRAPYMHDGCASSLTSLFIDSDCAGPMHRKLAALSGEDATAMQAYLLSL